MTIDASFAAWAAAQSETCKRALLDGTAAVMPVKEVFIVHGAGEPYRPASGKSTIKWAEKALHLRLDRQPAKLEAA